MKFIADSEKQTANLAKKLSNVIKPPLIVGFCGELGVGKTVFIRNLIKKYKKDERVKSPSFSIMEEYEYKNIKIFHVDLYRINKNEKNYLDLNNYYSEDCLIFIEWINNDKKLMKNSDIVININVMKKNNSREIELTGNSIIGKKIITELKNDF